VIIYLFIYSLATSLTFYFSIKVKRLSSFISHYQREPVLPERASITRESQYYQREPVLPERASITINATIL